MYKKKYKIINKFNHLGGKDKPLPEEYKEIVDTLTSDIIELLLKIFKNDKLFNFIKKNLLVYNDDDMFIDYLNKKISFKILKKQIEKKKSEKEIKKTEKEKEKIKKKEGKSPNPEPQSPNPEPQSPNPEPQSPNSDQQSPNSEQQSPEPEGQSSETDESKYTELLDTSRDNLKLEDKLSKFLTKLLNIFFQYKSQKKISFGNVKSCAQSFGSLVIYFFNLGLLYKCYN